MSDENRKRLAELEEQAEFDELDEEEREELRELRSMVREARRHKKALAKFEKARTVFRVIDPDDGDFFTLDLATAQKWAGNRLSVEEVSRKTLTGNYTTCLISGVYGDGDEFGFDEVYVADEEVQLCARA